MDFESEIVVALLHITLYTTLTANGSRIELRWQEHDGVAYFPQNFDEGKKEQLCYEKMCYDLLFDEKKNESLCYGKMCYAPTNPLPLLFTKVNIQII